MPAPDRIASSPVMASSVGLVVNPTAGNGGCREPGLTALLRRIGAERVLSDSDGLQHVDHDQVATVGLDLGAAHGPAATRALTRRLVTAGVDLIVAVGGDGTLADVAGELARRAAAPPLFGVGAGSINAGSLVTCRLDQVGQFDPCGARTVARDALVAQHCHGRSALAFNDVTVASTVIGTASCGQLVDLDARAMLEGHRIEARSEAIGSPEARVALISPRGTTTVAEGIEVGCVVVGLLDSRYYAKAIAGGACVAAAEGFGAACLISDQPIVSAVSPAGDPGMFRLRSVFCPLADHAELVIEGCSPASVLCADGNPLGPLAGELSGRVRLRRSAVVAVSATEGAR